MKNTKILILLTLLTAILMACENKGNPETTEINAMPVYTKKEIPNTEYDNVDANGIIKYDYGEEIGLQYNPLFIANDAISFYNDFHGYPEGYKPNPEYEKYFFRYVDWFIENSIYLEGVGRMLPYTFDSELGGKAPWYSAITQARVAKVFSYAYKWTEEEEYLNYINELVNPLFTEISKGGLLYSEGDIYYFEEYINPPDHSLNGHMSVILDLFEVNEVVKDDNIDSWIDKGIASLITTLPLYEMPKEMAFASKSSTGGDFKRFVPYETFIRSYDQIHIYYFEQLYKRTGNVIFKNYFYEYYGMLTLKEIYKKTSNILSNNFIAKISEHSPFFEAPNDLLVAFNNYRFDNNQYAAGNELTEGGEAFFVVDLKEAKPIEEITIQFRYPDYPRKFELQGYYDNAWHTIFKEENFESFNSTTSFYNLSYKGNESFHKLRFSASDFSNQNRLLLGHFSITEKYSNESLIRMWNDQLENSEVLSYIGQEIINSCSKESSECNVNESIIKEFAKKINADQADFWSISRPIIDSLTTGEAKFMAPN